MADAICWRMARSGRFVAPIAIIVSILDIASRGVFACTVVSDPSWPVFIAWSMSSASSPRVSPTTMRSGLEPRDVLLVQLKFRRVFNRDDALALRDERGQNVQQRRLAGAGAAADQHVEPRAHAVLEELEHRP